MDLDVLSRTPMSDIFASAPVGSGVVAELGRPIGITSSFIAVRWPRDPVMRGVIAGLRRAAASPWYPPLPHTAVMYRAGSVYLTRLVRCYGGECRVFVIPASSNYMYHVGDQSWYRLDGLIIWKLYMLLRWLYDHAILLAVSSFGFILFILVIQSRCFLSSADIRRTGIKVGL